MKLLRMMAVPLPLVVLLLISVGQQSPGAETRTELASPDGRLRVEVTLEARKFPYPSGLRPYYRVLYKDQTIIDYSLLGLAGVLEGGAAYKGVGRTTGDKVWINDFGTRREIRDRYNEAVISLQTKLHQVDLIFRAYDDGIAFRYNLPLRGNSASVGIIDELTSFNLTGNHTIYAQKAGLTTIFYEWPYTKMKMDDLSPAVRVTVPLLVRQGQGPWMALAEADLDGYAGMYLTGGRRGAHTFQATLAHKDSSQKYRVTGKTPFVTPWRVVMAGDEIGGLLESNLLTNLNDACALADTSWIKPGKAAWSWWSGNLTTAGKAGGGITTETMLHYADFAAEAGLAYLLIDDGWHKKGDITKPAGQLDLPRVIQYCRDRGVEVILWMDWHNLAGRIDPVLALYQNWGVGGVKIDFIRGDDPEMVDFCNTVVRKAAEHHLVVDFHGVYKPTGLERTYPNLLTQEGVRGLEYNHWTRWCDPDHTVMLAFTRALAGPMDFTPGGFRNAARGAFKPSADSPMTQGTRCHQLAMYVVYFSPLQMCSDYPDAYRGQKGFDFIREVPTVWDETRVLAADAGEYIITARRKGDCWYLGGMTNWHAREIEIPLAFLGPGTYRAEIYADGDDAKINAESTEISAETVRASDRIMARMAPGGGIAVRLVPVD